MDSEKIDFVLPWVDGNDPVWLAQKNKFAGIEKNMASGDANDDCRYRDFGLLRYWFRAVEHFAPWVHKIFFITCGQKPDWLNESTPKLRLVNHEDYIPKDYLPTFQSNTIELNLHRIHDLSEYFVLFNDDVFLLHPYSHNSFFKKGQPIIPCDLSIPRWLSYSNISRVALNNSGLVMRQLNINQLVWKNSMKFFNVFALGPCRAMKNLVSFAVNRIIISGTFGHIAQPHLKSTLDKIWQIYPTIMDRTSKHKFRNDDCVNQWLLSAWDMATGHFYPTNEKKIGTFINLDANNLDISCKLIRNSPTPQVCVNDKIPQGDDEVFSKCVAELVKAFDEILPQKSLFEK